MDDQMRKKLISNMTDNLPTLRKKLGISQEEFSAVLGVNRSTIAAIENRKRAMTWNMFLALLLVFIKNKETNQTNLCIGRCQYGEPLDLDHLYAVADAIHQNGIFLKINTVVSKLNLEENMKPVYTRLAPDKLKFLAMHVVENINGKAKDLAPTEDEYRIFVDKNEPETNTLVIVEEPGSMENAYFMVNPHGEVYMNDHGTERRYGCCLEQPLTSIFDAVPLSMEKYQKRYS